MWETISQEPATALGLIALVFGGVLTAYIHWASKRVEPPKRKVGR